MTSFTRQPPHRSPRRRRLAVSVLYIALSMACVPPAAADWLVTPDGHRIETQGPWKVKGRMVVYTDDRGTLSSLRLAEVDIEASQAAGKEPEAAPPEPVPTQKTPVLVLTNDDIPEGPETDPATLIAPRPELIMYSTQWCGVCRKARGLLADLGADYIEKDVDNNPEARREYVAKFGSDVRVPGFDYDGERFTGLRPAILETWVVQMKASK